MRAAFCKQFESSDFAMKGLQSSSLCVTDSISLTETLKVTYTTSHEDSDGKFDKLLILTEELAVKCEIACRDSTAFVTTSCLQSPMRLWSPEHWGNVHDQE